MKNFFRICLCLILALGNFSLFAADGKTRAVPQISTPIDSEMAEACGVNFRVQKGVRAMLVEQLQTEQVERCTIALTKVGHSDLPAEKGVVQGYQELSDLIMTVKVLPISARLPEFSFALASDADKSVIYVGQTLTDSAKKLGYTDETIKGFTVVSKNQARLYAGEAVISQRKPNGSKQMRKRLDVVWGDDSISVGASVWCQPEKLKDCDFQRYVRALFESMEVYRSK